MINIICPKCGTEKPRKHFQKDSGVVKMSIIPQKIKCYFGKHEIIKQKYLFGRKPGKYGMVIVFEHCKACKKFHDQLDFYVRAKSVDEDIFFEKYDEGKYA